MPILLHKISDQQLEGLIARLSVSPSERAHVLRRLLGESVCRQLGIYPLPDGFQLSVVIPVYN